MKLLVTIALACTLISKVHPLKCFACTSATPGTDCSQTQISTTCPASQTKCSSNRIRRVAAGTPTYTMNLRSCASQCSNASANFGISRTTLSTKCCDTDRCNNQDAPELPAANPNGRKCFTCVGNDCSSTLECRGPENRCVKTTVFLGGQTVTMKGCGSQNICSGDMNTALENIGLDLNCCEGNMCNNALRIGQSIFFLLLVPVASFMLLH